MKRIYIALALTLAVAAAAPAEDPIRLLVITGSHPYDVRFFSLFEGHSDIEWDKKTQSSKPCAAYSEGFAEGYDVVLLYDFEMSITDEQKDAFVNAFGGGRGLVVLHHAICSHPGWPKFREIAGGQFFFEEKDGHRKSEFTGGVQMTYKPAEGNHPITKGIAPFQVIEEPYKFVFQVDGAKPVLESDNEESDSVVAWTRTYKDSRVATIMPGHGWQIFEDPSYRRFIAQSIRWAAGRNTIPVE